TTALFLKIARQCQLAATTIVVTLGGLRRTYFRLGRRTATYAATTVVVIIRLAGLAELALRQRLARNRSGIRQRRRCGTRTTLLWTTALRATGLLRAGTLRSRTRIGASFGLRHTLCG